jgi:hypothetical protein
MKKIIRLTERDLSRIVKRVINEQVPLINLLGAASDVGVNIPNYADDLTVANRNATKTGCKVPKTTLEMCQELFNNLIKTKAPKIEDKKIGEWVSRLNKSAQGFGGEDISKILSEIPTLPAMVNVFQIYNKIYKNTRFKVTASNDEWNKIWEVMKKYNIENKVDSCKEYHPNPTLSS